MSPAAPSLCAPSSNIGVPAAPPTALVSTVTARPLLLGLVPGVTVALRWALPPAVTVPGVALAALKLGEVCCRMVRAIDVPEPLRISPSVTVRASDFAPGVAPASTVRSRPKTLSPAAPSLCMPSSNSGVLAAPLMLVRSTFTATSVLVGLVPGLTVALRCVVPPGSTEFGDAVPVTEGLVGEQFVVCEPRPLKVSTAKPSHSMAGSKTLVPSGSPAQTVLLRRMVLSVVFVGSTPQPAAPGSKPI